MKMTALPVAEGEYRGTRWRVFNGVVPVSELLDIPLSHYNWWSLDHQAGYRRQLDERYAKRIADDAANTPLLSLQPIVLMADAARLQNHTLTLSVPQDAEVQVLDGWHRIEALRMLRDDPPSEDANTISVEDLQLPVILLHVRPTAAADVIGALAFLLCHQGRNVDKGLVQRALQHLAAAQEEGRLPDEQLPLPLPRKLARQLIGLSDRLAMTEMLATENASPLRGLIQFPNEDKTKRSRYTVKQSVVVDSLYPFWYVASAHFEGQPEVMGRFVINMWRAMQKLVPEAWEEVRANHRPLSLLLLQARGMRVMHNLAAQLFTMLPVKEELDDGTIVRDASVAAFEQLLAQTPAADTQMWVDPRAKNRPPTAKAMARRIANAIAVQA